MKIVHLADLHLGYKAYNKMDKAGFNLREKDVIRAFQEALDKISQINPDLIVIAGDIFHKPRPSNTTLLLSIKLLIKFRETCNSPIIMISGNHEAVKSVESGSVLTIFENVIPRVKVINDIIQEVPIEHLQTSVTCVPHGGLAGLEKTSLTPNKDYKYNIMVIHGTYENCPELAGYGNGALIKGDDISQSQWDYVAFGHYHSYTKLAENTFYAGAIERTTTNIWQEAKEDKGFIVFDLETKIPEFIKLSSPRKVIDLKKISCDNLAAEDINKIIFEEIDKIINLDKSIVRMSLDNIDPVAIRNLDYKRIREIKKTAVHFRLNIIKKDSQIANSTENGELVDKRKGISDYLEEELKQFELSNSLDKCKFNRLAKEYLEIV